MDTAMSLAEDNPRPARHLERSVPMLLSLSLCGLSLAGADVAGFMGDPDVELFVRWHQLGIWRRDRTGDQPSNNQATTKQQPPHQPINSDTG